MGREVNAPVSFRGATAETRLLLEATELILRAGHKARLARETISAVSAGADGLRLSAAGEPLHAALGEAEAARWATALVTPPPSLASKLGIGPDQPALVLGEIDDAALAAALKHAATADPAAATVVIAMIASAANLDCARAAAADHALALWCVYPKGPAASFGDAAIRAAMRAAGWIDTKVSAVSAALTATRYTRRGPV